MTKGTVRTHGCPPARVDTAGVGSGADGVYLDADYPAEPYPGARPERSFVQLDGIGRPLTYDGGWHVGDADLDGWLAAAAVPPLADRVPVLAYGSNACPSKISWLRSAHGLAGPVVVLRVRCAGVAAVWAAGRRVVDDQRPTTLAALPGVSEVHAVWLATAGQLRALDACEGRGVRYDLAAVHTGTVTALDSGAALAAPLAYVGRAAAAGPEGGRRLDRRPLLVAGAMVRCADVPQAAAAALVGVPATDDGLDRTVLRPPFPSPSGAGSGP